MKGTLNMESNNNQNQYKNNDYEIVNEIGENA